MIKNNNNLIFLRGIQLPLNCNDPVITNDNNVFIANLIPTAGELPPNPPFEIHPYKDDFPLKDFEMYVIGTFPPISYILDNIQLAATPFNTLTQPNCAGGQIINRPRIPFYHGNQGSMWDFLLTPQEIAVLNETLNGENGRQNAKQYLINFLLNNKINYSDIIDSTQRNLNALGRYDGKDTNLNNICVNNSLICHILNNKNAKYLLFNSSSTFGAMGLNTLANGMVNVNNNTKSFDLFVRHCQELGLEIQMRIQNGNPANVFNWMNITALNPAQKSNKIIFELKLKNPANNKKLTCDKFETGSEKIITVVTGPSPSAINQLGLIGNIICDKWLLANPGNNRLNFIHWVYQNFRNNNINAYFPLNS